MSDWCQSPFLLFHALKRIKRKTVLKPAQLVGDFNVESASSLPLPHRLRCTFGTGFSMTRMIGNKFHRLLLSRISLNLIAVKFVGRLFVAQHGYMLFDGRRNRLMSKDTFIRNDLSHRREIPHFQNVCKRVSRLINVYVRAPAN